MTAKSIIAGICTLVGLFTAVGIAAEPTETAAARGFRILTEKTFLPADFDDAVFDRLWECWPKDEREIARHATPAERRRLTFEHYGLMERPGSDGTGPALGYVPNGETGWVMNCLACHTGKVEGKVILGAPNSHYALETLTEDVRFTKLRLGKRLTHMDLANLDMPLGGTRGTTNAVVFGLALGMFRDLHVNFNRSARPQTFIHHDLDAPAFWNVKRKKYLYFEGAVPKSHRPLMQFLMLPSNSGETIRGWENDYRDVLAWIESLEPPKYTGTIDSELAKRGQIAFTSHCAECHGTYGAESKYPERIIPLEEIGTDPVRYESLTDEYRDLLRESWFGDYGRNYTETRAAGYVAPPLNGIWASAPYFHNGSVPTLWHVLHPDERPALWQRTENGYDHVRLGLEVITAPAMPGGLARSKQRTWFDTSKTSKSSAGHLYPNRLTEEQKRAVLEYLKTL